MLEVDRVGKVPEDADEAGKKSYKWDIVWLNVIVMIFLHVGAVYGFYLRFTAGFATAMFGKVVGILSGIGVTAGAHRLWCHRTYKANKLVQIIIMCLFSMTMQNSIYTWCRDHRLHHKHSETDADPHNAKRGFFFSHVGWLLIRKHEEVKEKGKDLDMSDLKNDPLVVFHHKYYLWIVLFFSLVMPMYVAMVLFGEPLSTSFYSVFVYRYVISLHMTWSINSVAHIFGSKPYDKSIGATDNGLMKIIALGEGSHNYHHVFPWDYRTAELGGHPTNLTTYIIDGFARLGWVWDRKKVNEKLVAQKAARTGDGSHCEGFPNILINGERKGGTFIAWLYLAIYFYLV